MRPTPHTTVAHPTDTNADSRWDRIPTASEALIGMPVSARDSWIFDMDGTLTLANHDFEAIRAELRLPSGVPILEEIARRPSDEAARLYQRLDEIELAIARESNAQPGSHELLSTIADAGWRCGILTRNSEENARETLAACGLDVFFDSQNIVGRESSAPKPKPDGIHTLLAHWRRNAASAVIVGDYQYDLVAGRRAGVSCVYFDPEGSRKWESQADLRIEHLSELTELLSQSAGAKDISIRGSDD